MEMLQPGYQLATIADLNLLLIMMQELYEYDRLTFHRDAAQQALQRLLQNSSLGRIWLIKQRDEVIGYVVVTLGYSLEYQGRDAFVDELYVRPTYRRQGVGSQTLQFAEEMCRALDVKALHLEVERENKGAQQFYRKMGYGDHDRFLLTKWL